MTAELLVLSNRGPVSFAEDGAARRGAGGLVSTLGPAVAGRDVLWLACAMGPGDRAVAGRGIVDAGGFSLRLLDVPEQDYRAFYDDVCNRTLWFAHHGLDDKPLAPSLGRSWHRAWDRFVEVNRLFADAVVDLAAERATVLVQDLHLSLVGAMVAERRPDLRTAHFSHTPFGWPGDLSVLPRDKRVALLSGLAGHGACGFHSERWADAFLASCRADGVEPPPVFVSPAAIDPGDVGGVDAGSAAAGHREAIEALAAGRRLVVRVDRMELSKNVLRGFEAFDLLLREHPEHRGSVAFVACCYPSREGLEEYRAYRAACEQAVAELNRDWGGGGPEPVVLFAEDDFPRSVAALSLADVVLVNPVRDGLNVVAKEMTVVNRRDAALCLSPEAGVWDELGGAGALEVPPFDVAGTADALHTALSLDEADRRQRFATLKQAALARTPADWLADQVDAARPAR